MSTCLPLIPPGDPTAARPNRDGRVPTPANSRAPCRGLPASKHQQLAEEPRGRKSFELETQWELTCLQGQKDQECPQSKVRSGQRLEPSPGKQDERAEPRPPPDE